MKIKDFTAAVKAAGTDDGLGDGQVRMLVSAFGNVDSYGDVVMPGAFTNSLNEWAAKGDPIPFIWSHQWSDPFSHIGTVTDAAETEAGLEVTAQLDLTNDKAKQVFALLKARRVTQASFGYDILEAGWAEREAPDGAKYEVYELRQLDLFECGPCLVGANQQTELLEAKARELADGVRAGRAPQLAEIKSLAAALTELGAALTTKTSGTEPDAAPPSADPTAPTGQPDERDHELPSSKSAQARARLSLMESEDSQ